MKTMGVNSRATMAPWTCTVVIWGAVLVVWRQFFIRHWILQAMTTGLDSGLDPLKQTCKHIDVFWCFKIERRHVVYDTRNLYNISWQWDAYRRQMSQDKRNQALQYRVNLIGSTYTLYREIFTSLFYSLFIFVFSRWI